MSHVKNWVLAFRPKTLTASVVPIVAATSLVYSEREAVSWLIVILALVSSLCIQIATNLFNDAIDHRKGADLPDRLGPIRVTATGVFSYKHVFMAAFSFSGIALLCGIPLVVMGGWPILVIGLLSLFFGYAYTGGPYPLAYKGLGDFFVVLFFGLVAVMGLSYLQMGWNHWQDSLVLGAQVGLHCAVLIAVNNLRDVDQDRRAGKMTLPVRFGKSFGRWEIGTLCFLPFVLNIYWYNQGHPWACLLPCACLPLAIRLTKSVFVTEPGTIYNSFLARAAGLHFLFGVLLSCGLLGTSQIS